MRAILAVARAYVRHEWKVALLPIGAGVAALILRAISPATTAVMALGGLAALGAPVAAVLLGLSVLGPDLRQRRLSFFLTRPASIWKLWCGRMLGAVAVLTLASMPMVLAAILGGPGVNASPSAASSWMLLIPALMLFLVVNIATCILLSYSWDAFLIDLAAIGLLVAAGSHLFRPLLDLFGTPETAFMAGMAVLFWAVVATAPAGLALLAGGRGRAKWGHRWFSWTFWPLVSLAVLGVHIWRAQEIRTPIEAVLRRYAMVKPLDNERFLVNLWGRGVQNRWFAVNPKTGAAERMNGWSYSRVVSKDGGFTGWIRVRDPRSRSYEFSLVVAKTAAPAEPASEANAPFRLVDLSDGGELALFRVDRGLRLMDTASGQFVGDIGAPEFADVRSVRFEDDRSVRAQIWEKAVFRLVRFSFTGEVIEEKRIERPQGARLVYHEPTGQYSIAGKTEIVLYTREGKSVGAMSGTGPVGFFTRSGTLVVQTRNTAAVLTGDGAAPRVIPLFANRIAISGELDSGEVVVQFDGDGARRVAMIDPKTATVLQVFDGVSPLFRFKRDFNEVPSEFNGSTLGLDTSLRAFQNEDGDLFYLDKGATKLRLLFKSTLGEL